MYLLIKHLHMTCALISICGFMLRGYWMWVESAKLNYKWVKILPHIVDTTLLASAIYLAVSIQQYPFQNTWLTAKLVALILYILLGTIALKKGKTAGTRKLALIGSVIVFAYIIAVARSHNPLVIF